MKKGTPCASLHVNLRGCTLYGDFSVFPVLYSCHALFLFLADDREDDPDQIDLISANQILLREVENIREDINRVRTSLSDMYAEDLGKNCRLQ
eukprot:m.71731 g.71731  ORF g.71731 m.71731 type:complete len:93 (+) comp35761_c0_seq5:1587-1865(+)